MRDDLPEGVVHEVDGIMEQDNRLPNWWLYSFYGTIVFAVGYWLWFHELPAGKSRLVSYKAEMVAAKKAEAEKLMAMGELTDDTLREMAANPALVAEGAEIYKTTCAPCHMPNGGGQIGPNLTDEFWLHGGKPTDIARTIREGVVEKGMVAWGPQLGEAKVRAVTAYVLTMVGTNVPGGKAPQGEKLATATVERR